MVLIYIFIRVTIFWIAHCTRRVWLSSELLSYKLLAILYKIHLYPHWRTIIYNNQPIQYSYVRATHSTKAIFWPNQLGRLRSLLSYQLKHRSINCSRLYLCHLLVWKCCLKYRTMTFLYQWMEQCHQEKQRDLYIDLKSLRSLLWILLSPSYLVTPHYSH